MCDHDHSGGDQDNHAAGFRPSWQAVFSNWRRSDAPFLAKLGMALRNNWIKISHGTSCCGHHGEVGC